MQHLLDFILNVEEGVVDDTAMINGLMKTHRLAEPPSILQPKGPVAHNFVMNLAIVPGERAGRVHVLKHFVFEDKPPLSVALAVVQGHAKLINMGTNKRAGVRPFMYMWQRVGGFQVSHFRFKQFGGRAKEIEAGGH